MRRWRGFSPTASSRKATPPRSWWHALSAFYRKVPFVHVEAGLRTGNLQAPWPEEMNRRVASIVTTIHCAPTTKSADNLRAEHVPEASIFVTGNTVIDALLWAVERERAAPPAGAISTPCLATIAWC